jgi:PREDICTED: hypothetical protein LOC701581
MKIKNHIGAFALGCAMLLPLMNLNAQASELTINTKNTKENTIENQNTVTKDLKNEDLSSKIGVDSYKKDDLSDNKDDEFDKEFQTRLDLAREIKLLENYNYDDKAILKESYDILNSSDLEKISGQTQALQLLIDQIPNKDLKKSISIDNKEEKAIKESISGYLSDGILIGLDPTNKDNLDTFIEAIKNSKSYNEADDKLKEKYDEVLKSASENKDYKEASELIVDFIKDPKKKDYKLEDSVTSYNENIKFQSSNSDNDDDSLVIDESTFENPSQNDSNETETTSNRQSAFLKNEKTKSKYNELSDSQKRELDTIDDNNDAKISKEELDNSANYSSSLGEDSWIYPFTEKALSENDNSKESSNKSDSKNSEKNTNSKSEDDNKDTSSKAIPQTVTIDEKKVKSPELKTDDSAKSSSDNKEENKDFNEDESSKKIVKENKNAASVVKTGIKGVKIILVVLIVAIIAYYFVAKDKNKRK